MVPRPLDCCLDLYLRGTFLVDDHVMDSQMNGREENQEENLDCFQGKNVVPGTLVVVFFRDSYRVAHNCPSANSRAFPYALPSLILGHPARDDVLARVHHPEVLGLEGLAFVLPIYLRFALDYLS